LASALDVQPQEAATPDLEELLDKVEQMTDEEARALLGRSRSQFTGAA
jgi:hypothetical protein